MAGYKPFAINDLESGICGGVEPTVASARKPRIPFGLVSVGKIDGSPTGSHVYSCSALADVSASEMAIHTAISSVVPKPPPVKNRTSPRPAPLDRQGQCQNRKHGHHEHSGAELRTSHHVSSLFQCDSVPALVMSCGTDAEGRCKSISNGVNSTAARPLLTAEVNRMPNDLPLGGPDSRRPQEVCAIQPACPGDAVDQAA